jgi:predicted RNA-binding Zn-ribbon protein involved in translation (DUF1610 family)
MRRAVQHLYTVPMRYWAILPLSILLAGCETSSPVVPAGKDSYMVSSHVGACVSCSATVTSLQTANAYCAKQGKVAIVRNSNSTTNAFGYTVGDQTTFSCVSSDDPEYTRPSMRKENGVTTIENK